VVLLDANEKSAAEAAREIRRCRRQGGGFALDVTRREDCVTSPRRSPARLDRSRSCHNARHRPGNGMLGRRSCNQGLEDIIAINLTGVFNVTHAFLAPLRAARAASQHRLDPVVHACCSRRVRRLHRSKHGVLGFTRALAASSGQDGVRVNAIGPGFIERR